MKTIAFTWMILTGSIKPQEKHEGHMTYAVFVKDSTGTEMVYDYAYKEEIIQWLKTNKKTFVYNEDLTINKK
jgi:hypothetical protein